MRVCRVHRAHAPGLKTATARNRDRECARDRGNRESSNDPARRQREDVQRCGGPSQLKKSAGVVRHPPALPNMKQFLID